MTKDVAMQAGLDVERFWSLSFAEIKDFVLSKSKAKETRLKESMKARAVMDYHLAQLIAIAMCNSREFPRSAETAYPELFRQPVDSGWQAVKAHMESFRCAHKAGDAV